MIATKALSFLGFSILIKIYHGVFLKIKTNIPYNRTRLNNIQQIIVEHCPQSLTICCLKLLAIYYPNVKRPLAEGVTHKTKFSQTFALHMAHLRNKFVGLI